MWCVNKKKYVYILFDYQILTYLRGGSLSSQAPLPDTYRGLYREDHPDPGQAYADTVRDLIEEVHKKGRKVGSSTVMTRMM